MNTRYSRYSGLKLIPVVLLAFAGQAAAVTFTCSQTGPATWKYDITFDPFDNYSIFQPNTTITLSGLSGVTAAGGATSTDFPAGSLADTVNLLWTAQVTNGGTTVVWTHVGGGTGNYPTTQHVYGFSVTAAGASNGTVSYSTSGFAKDVGNGGTPSDISGSIAGPKGVAGGPVSAPMASPLALALMFLGLACAGGLLVKCRFMQRFQHRA